MILSHCCLNSATKSIKSSCLDCCSVAMHCSTAAGSPQLTADCKFETLVMSTSLKSSILVGDTRPGFLDSRVPIDAHLRSHHSDHLLDLLHDHRLLPQCLHLRRSLLRLLRRLHLHPYLQRCSRPGAAGASDPHSMLGCCSASAIAATTAIAELPFATIRKPDVLLDRSSHAW